MGSSCESDRPCCVMTDDWGVLRLRCFFLLTQALLMIQEIDEVELHVKRGNTCIATSEVRCERLLRAP